jgi:hypothetical protein
MRLSTSRLDERDFDSLPPALRRKVSASRTTCFSFSPFANRSMSCVPACAWYDPCKMESAARPSTGRCKIFATKSGYLGAKNLIASAYRCAIQQGFNELTRLFTGVGMEWFTGKRSRGPPRHAVMHLSHTAHTPNYHICRSTCFISPFRPRRTRSLASF